MGTRCNRAPARVNYQNLYILQVLINLFLYLPVNNYTNRKEYISRIA
jgi:hypothetical protein